MRSRTFLLINVLVLAMGACNPVQVPANVTDTPVTLTDTPTPMPVSTNVPSLIPLDVPVYSSPTLVQITFQDANNGWGVASNGSGSILRTVDGGTTWLNITPPGLTGIGRSTDLSVLDVNHVWLLVPNVDFFTGMLYRTSDGGHNWTSFEVPFGGASLQFLDANTGFALADRGAGAGSQSVEMYQTSDGGASWLSVFNDDPTRPDSSTSLPLSGIKNGMFFLDANTGWVAGTRPVPGEVYLFVTHDGGIDWEQQIVPLPAGYEAYQFLPQAPVFFGTDGFLPLIISQLNSTDFTFYSTQDGGATWTGDPTNANSLVPPACHYAFADALHGWCWDGRTNLYFTIDGAQTWSVKQPSLNLSDQLSQMEFVPGTADQFTGWALTGEDEAGHSQLYKTADSGKTWTPLIVFDTSPTPPLTTVSSPGIVKLHMFDVNNGWAISETSVLRTTDGGVTWIDAGLSGLSGAPTSSFFLNITTGWVAVPGAEPTSGTLHHTTDGGVTWTSITVPFAGGSIEFVDPLHGWELVGLGAGMSHEAVAIFRTSDGGTTWSQVFINDPNASSSSDSLPFVGDKNGISALDANNGWVTGSQPSDNFIYVYSTRDGGFTWTHQDLTLPIGYSNAMTDAYLPVFFGARDAILPVRLYATDIGAEFYISHDGGQNWTATTPVAQEGLFSIASATDFFVWDGGSSLKVTHDAGASWSTVTPNVNLQGTISSMEFVNANTGWVITSDSSNHKSLYKTIDGGKTWNILNP